MTTTESQVTLKEAKEILRASARKGARCPCCGQNVKMYSRPLNSSMVYGLILLSRAPVRWKDSEGFIHVENYLRSIENLPAAVRGDIPKLRFWGFIQAKEQDRIDGNPSSGYYRVLNDGLDFINGWKLVQQKVLIYNNKPRGFEGPMIDVFGAIKKKFNYNELMGRS